MSRRLHVFFGVFIDLDLSDETIGLEDSLLLLLVEVIVFGVVGSIEGVVGTFAYVVGFTT